jgi:hypothetical protein
MLTSGSGVHPVIIPVYFYFLVIGVVVSLPTFFLFSLACKELSYFELAERIIKLFLALVAISGTWFPIYLIMGKETFSTKDEFGITIPISYSLAILFSAQVYRLKKPQEMLII